jgi:tricarballylate dehydrogenase
MEQKIFESDYDIVVLGSGVAGLTAALSGRAHGAQVLLLEKAPPSQRGGNSRRSGSFRVAYGDLRSLKVLIQDLEGRAIQVPPYTEDDYYQDLMRVTSNKADPELARALVSNSWGTLLWLRELGVEFELSTMDAIKVADSAVFPPGSALRVKGGGEGEALTKTLFQRVEEQHIPVIYAVRVTSLLRNEVGRICGVSLRTGGESKTVHGKAVVLACGGFEANAEMRSRYLGPEWEHVKIRGTSHNTGDGIRLALEAGADTTGDWGGAHAGMIDAKAPDVWSTNRAIRRSYHYGIIVNSEGRRFFDEGEDFEPLLYAKLGRAVLRQPGGIAFQIFDEKVKHLLSPYYSDATQVVASSIEELAAQVHIDSVVLKFTVAEFNQAILEVPFNPGIKDGKGTRGITPPKSNWAQPIDVPPFRAVPGVCGITFTFGGVRTDSRSRVIGKEGQPIPGLYAAGATTGGLLYDHYPLGASLMQATVFGRIAGKAAATENE